MAVLEYTTKNFIESCRHKGSAAIVAGEEVKVTLSPKNPDWVESFKGFLNQPPTYNKDYITYYIEYDESVLNGVILPESCDVENVVCWSCCDQNEATLQNLINTLVDGGIITENTDGTFTTV